MSRTSRVRVAAVVFFHVTTALTSILANKAVLNTAPIPAALLACHAGVTLIALEVLIRSRVLDPLPRLTGMTFRQLWPLLALRMLAQLGKTLCLQHVQAAFYQISRGLLLPLTLILSALILPDPHPSVLAIAAACLTTGGFLLGVSHEQVSQTSHLGIALGVLSSLTTALETIMIKRTVSGGQHEVVQLVHLIALVGLAPYLVFSFLAGEHHALLQATNLASLLLLASVAACLLSLATLLQIKLTSPTTHMIATSARGVLQASLAVLLFQGEHMPASRLASLAVILIGSMSYTFAKEMEHRRREQKTQTQSASSE